jgi:putative PIN family toxin of toxin-antitoxin system
MDLILDIGRLVFSSATFAELDGRIWQPKFDRYLPMERRRLILQMARASAVWVDISGELAQRAFSRDPKDDAFIHAALASGASRLVSGDDDLLCLDPVGDVRILTPRAALNELVVSKTT